MQSFQSLLKSHLHFLKHSLDLREAQIGFFIQDQLVILIKPSAKIYFVLNFLKLSPAFDWIQIS